MALTKVIGDGLGDTNDLTVDTSTLKVDSTNNRVGILEASPQAPLHITTGANTNIMRFGADARWGFQRANSDNRYLSLSRAMNGTPSSVMVVDGDNGAITKPLQPAFLVQPTSAQNDISHGSNQTIIFNNERFDVGSNFASNTFTAPITGKYFLSYSLWVSNIDNQPSYWETYIITSNRNYLYTIDPRAFDQDAGSFTFNNSLIADMDSGDTAKIQILQQNSGTEQSDIQNYSFFSGALIC
jgi:hypothetical protein